MNDHNHSSVFFLELNEFNPDLLEKGAHQLKLPNLIRLTSLHKVQTYTEDTYESDFLEPWVQWVSVHTGVPSKEHKIKHLGDVPHLDNQQMWEKLSTLGYTSGVWGAMNARRGSAEKCLFFLPDPWTVSENGYPQELSFLLDPVRYLSQNYLKHSKRVVLHQIWNLVRLVKKNNLLIRFLSEIPRLLKNCIRFRAKNFVFIAFGEYLSALLFFQYRRKYHPDFSLIFINTLAHVQHHYWKNLSPKENEPIVCALEYLDRIVGAIFDTLGEKDVLIVANALSQKNTNEESPWILYRQHDQGEFLRTIGIRFERVESLMTHDAHIFFKTKEDAQAAYTTLSSIEIKGQKLFLVERYPSDAKKLFYRIAFTDPVEKETSFVVQNSSFRFLSLFEPIVQRTGKHIPQGMVYTNQKVPFESIKNHEIFNWVVGLYR